MNPVIIFAKAQKIINNSLIAELNNQGHYLTGALNRSITTTSSIISKPNETSLNGYALKYAQDLETGKNATQLGNINTHTKNLITYFLKRGLKKGEAVRAAIATAKRHQKEGVPTLASKRFSKTGERKGFITRAWKENEQKVDSVMDLGMDSIFNEEFNKQKSEKL
ncbi:hypothetical protein ETU08_00085 [Apibacter muscae]|uniref:hypothetical protein n=1 Tax=Apibacter muscae TaxID=2509004 RepID=UPI0011AE0453|nr:hypothetical protein [Apibacter muscae]TWP31892.1 hypothetical protein ETU08_00085 [Apibacter muscae]